MKFQLHKHYYINLNLYQYLKWDSDHPLDIFRGIYIGEIYRYLRACSERKEFEKIKNKFKERLMNRGWPIKNLIKFDKAAPNFHKRNKVLRKKEKRNFKPSKLRFKLTFTKNGIDKKMIKEILKHHWKKLPTDLHDKFPDIHYKYNRNFSSLFTA